MLRLSRGVLAVEHIASDDERIDVALNDDLFKPPENFAVLVFAREPPQRLTDMPISRVKDTYHGSLLLRPLRRRGARPFLGDCAPIDCALFGQRPDLPEIRIGRLWALGIRQFIHLHQNRDRGCPAEQNCLP